MSSVGFCSLLIAAPVGASSLRSVVGIAEVNPGQPLNLANRCQTVCSERCPRCRGAGAGLLPRLPNYCTTRVVIVISAGEMRRTLLPFAVITIVSPHWVHIGGQCSGLLAVYAWAPEPAHILV